MNRVLLIFDFVLPSLMMVSGIVLHKTSREKVSTRLSLCLPGATLAPDCRRFAAKTIARCLLREGALAIVLCLIFSIVGARYCPIEVQAGITLFLLLLETSSLAVSAAAVESKARTLLDENAKK